MAQYLRVDSWLFWPTVPYSVSRTPSRPEAIQGHNLPNFQPGYSRKKPLLLKLFCLAFLFSFFVGNSFSSQLLFGYGLVLARETRLSACCSVHDLKAGHLELTQEILGLVMIET